MLVSLSHWTGYHFVKWSDGSAENPRTDTNVKSDITVEAEFAINQYTLTYIAGSNGAITGDTSQTINHGNNGSEVTATPNTGYHFVGWSDGVETAARTDTNITENLTLTANFSVNQYTLFYVAGTNGSVTGEVSQTVEHGKDGTEILAIPESGYHFVRWSDGSTDNPRTDREVTGNISASAEFAINTYTVSYDTGDQGSVYGPPPQVLDHGTFGGSVIAVPTEGYHFAQWSDGVTENPRTDQTVTGNITVTAEFALNQYRLSYSAENGSIEGDTPQSIGHGNDGTEVKAVPDEGYRFVKWSDGSSDNPRTDTSVTADITDEAEFERVTYSRKVVLTEPDFQRFPVPEAFFWASP